MRSLEELILEKGINDFKGAFLNENLIFELKIRFPHAEIRPVRYGQVTTRDFKARRLNIIWKTFYGENKDERLAMIDFLTWG